ncbi:MAG TPA: transcriptional regulator [Phycisphaerales bacterium]|nr:transcriptional regulator [Phycisphaerales bacterium]HCD31179.1 transcriptional regulator [Phycisphaerales bacterium]|tara:strand:+ start:536 stop:961 length:426 start_codon:yes stop_codon:yes gene_type:complete
MPTTRKTQVKLPRRFGDLVALMAPQAIMDEVHYDNAVDMIDQLMAINTLSKGQELYLETWVQLVSAYEANHHAIDTSDLTGIDLLSELLAQNDMNASDLARLLGVHASMGSKILKGERALTIEHLRKLTERFLVKPDVFMS